MLPNAILFDLDDTILTDDVVSEPAWEEACKICGEKTKLFNSQELFRHIFYIREWFWSDPERIEKGRLNLDQARMYIVEKALKEMGVNSEGTAREIVNNFTRLKEELIGLCPNVENTLGSLVNKEIKLALLTNGDGKLQRAKIKRFGLSKYFGVCLIEGELGFGKPDPRFYTTALTKLEALPEHAWMVGNDLTYDIDGAQKVGIFSVWYDYDKKGLPDNSGVKPDSIINDISEVISLF